MKIKPTIEQSWEILFDKHNIVKKVREDGIFKISSAEINTIKEARLMAKFDKSSKLPKVFRDNNLSILPISRGEYAIGNFKTHEKLNYSNTNPIMTRTPSFLQTINKSDLYSESAALLFAFNSGIIADVLQTYGLKFTVNGRMSSGSFNFKIDDTITSKKHNIHVRNAQIEIDAGYETNDVFCICEAKNIATEEILIRQLYYPYRLWKSKISKTIIPAFIVYTNDIFHAFIYEFSNINNYNSLKLLQHKVYTFIEDKLSFSETVNMFKSINKVIEPKVQFPQADSFERIIDLLSILFEKQLTHDEVTLKYEFDSRQTDYYISACEYLSLVERIENNNRERCYRLTNDARIIMQLNYSTKYLELIKRILSCPVFNIAFGSYLITSKIPTKQEICNIMSKASLNLSDSTIKRRSSTVRGWLNWIIKNIENYL